MNSIIPPLLACLRLGFVFGLLHCLFVDPLIPSAAAQQSTQYNFQAPIYSYQGKDRETGVRLGRFRLHGALGLNNTYDTNAFYADAAPQGDMVFQIIPGADLAWESSHLNFISGYRFTLRDNFSNNEQDDRQHHVQMETNYRFTPRVIFSAKDAFEVSSDPADVELPERLGRRSNEAHGEVKLSTPAEDLDVAIGYTNHYQKYEGSLAALGFFNNKVSVTSRMNVSSNFRFLPKSVAFGGAEYGRTTFNEDPTTTGLTSSNSQGLNFHGGITSQISHKIALTGRLGAAFIYFDSGPDSKGVTGGGDVAYSPNAVLKFRGGYEHAIEVSTFTNARSDHVFRLNAEWKVTRKIGFQTTLVNSFLDFSGPNTNVDGTNRKDFVIQNSSSISYQFIEWGTIRLSYQLDRRTSNTVDPVFGSSSANFLKQQVSLGADFYY